LEVPIEKGGQKKKKIKRENHYANTLQPKGSVAIKLREEGVGSKKTQPGAESRQNGPGKMAILFLPARTATCKKQEKKKKKQQEKEEMHSEGGGTS